jgi:hypothetical protein
VPGLGYWTGSEDSRLNKLHTQGLPLADAAKELGRTEEDVKHRMVELNSGGDERAFGKSLPAHGRSLNDRARDYLPITERPKFRSELPWTIVEDLRLLEFRQTAFSTIARDLYRLSCQVASRKTQLLNVQQKLYSERLSEEQIGLLFKWRQAGNKWEDVAKRFPHHSMASLRHQYDYCDRDERDRAQEEELKWFYKFLKDQGRALGIVADVLSLRPRENRHDSIGILHDRLEFELRVGKKQGVDSLGGPGPRVQR